MGASASARGRIPERRHRRWRDPSVFPFRAAHGPCPPPCRRQAHTILGWTASELCTATVLGAVEELMPMITERLQAAVDRAAQLPDEAQDELAVALEQALERTSATWIPPQAPPLALDVRAAFERALAENAATLKYL